jgi:hypothetical protein
MSDDRYRMLPDLVRIPVGDGGGVAHDIFALESNEADAQLLDAHSMGMLSRCEQFATLSEHAAAIARDVDEAPDAAVVEQRLGELAAMGLLASERQLREALCEPCSDVAPPAVSAIGVPTRGRPELLRACVTSYVEATADRELEVVIADDARDDAEAAATRQMLDALSVRPGVTLLYAGRVEKLRYAEVLAARSELRPELVRFAIAPDDTRQLGIGANRNALLLHQAGGLALQVDDDTCAELAPVPASQYALTISDDALPRGHWFPEPGSDAESLRTCQQLDPCQLHERALGRSVRGCAGAIEANVVHVGAVTGRLLRQLRRHPGHVLSTQLGIAGDVATGSLAHYLLFGGVARERLHRSPAHYQHAIASRQVMAGVTSTTITDSAFCMSFALGLDHRELLPPFAPLGRNEDGIFGLVQHHCFRDGYTAMLPWTVAHRPPPRPSSRESMAEGARRVSTNDLMVRLVAASDVRALHENPRDNMGALGDHLLRLGTLDQSTFEGLMRQTLMRTRSQDLRMLRDALAKFGQQPNYWAVDVHRLIDTLSEAMVRPDHSRPLDLEERFGVDEAPAAFQRRLRNYGELLHHWPTMFDAAKQLRDEGVRVARPL